MLSIKKENDRKLFHKLEAKKRVQQQIVEQQARNTQIRLNSKVHIDKKFHDIYQAKREEHAVQVEQSRKYEI